MSFLLSYFFRLSSELLEHETLDFQKIYQILGPKPFKHRESFRKYLDDVIEIEKNPDFGL